MPLTKKELEKILKEIPQYTQYKMQGNSLQSDCRDLGIKLATLDLTEDQINSILKSRSRESKPGLDNILDGIFKELGADNSSKNLPTGMEKKAYSGKEAAKRDTLSKNALDAYSSSLVGHQFMAAFSPEIMEKNGLTEDDLKEFKISRDLGGFVLESGLGKELQDKNAKIIKHMLGKDIDPSRYKNKEEFEAIKKQQYLEVVNNRMRELVEFDYSQYDNLTDEQLVEKWPEIENRYHAISIGKDAIKDIENHIGKLDSHLCEKMLDVEASRFGMEYNYDCSRMRAIASPYYAQNDPAMWFGTDYKTFGTIIEYISLESYGARASEFAAEIAGMRESKQAVIEEDIRRIINADNETVVEPKFFNLKGEKVTSDMIMDYAAGDGVIFAATDGDPSKTTAFTYDKYTGVLGNADQKKYEKQISEINKNIKDLANEKKAREEALLKEHPVVQTLMNTSDNIPSCMSRIIAENDQLASAPGSKSVDEIDNDVIELIDKYFLGKKSVLDVDQFGELLGVKRSDRPSQKEFNERRQLSKDMIRAQLKSERLTMAGKAGFEKFDKQYAASKINKRRAEFFFCEHGSGKLKSNEDRIKTILDLDDNLQAKNTDPEKLNEIRNEIVKQRLDELKLLSDKLTGKSFTDRDLIDNWDTIAEFSIGMGMEWDGLKSDFKAMGFTMNDDVKKQAAELHELANQVHASMKCRGLCMANQYYAHGCETGLDDPETFLAKSFGKGDKRLEEYFVSVTTSRTNQIESLADVTMNSNGINPEDIDFVVDNRGKEVGSEKVDIGRSLEKDPAMIFLKGKDDPVVITVSHDNKIPVKTEQKKLTQELQKEVTFARGSHDLSKIEKSGLSQQRQELEEDLLQSRIELTVINESYEKAPEGKKEAYKQDLERNFTKYMARLVIKKQDEKEPMSEAQMKEMLSGKSINESVQSLNKNGAVTRLFEEVLASKKPFDRLDEKELHSKLMDYQKEAKTAELNKDNPQAVKNNEVKTINTGKTL